MSPLLDKGSKTSAFKPDWQGQVSGVRTLEPRKEDGKDSAIKNRESHFVGRGRGDGRASAEGRASDDAKGKFLARPVEKEAGLAKSGPEQAVVGGTVRLAPYLAARTDLSRRQAETAILEGRIQVDGQVWRQFYAPEHCMIALDGYALEEAKPMARLWVYHKPPGQIVSRIDPQGRPTIFQAVASQLGSIVQGQRLLSVGRLDYESEGLLLITNTPALAHFLETSRLVRTYQVWVEGCPDARTFDDLARGMVVDGVQYRPCHARLDPLQGTRQTAVNPGSGNDRLAQTHAVGRTDGGLPVKEGRRFVSTIPVIGPPQAWQNGPEGRGWHASAKSSSQQRLTPLQVQLDEGKKREIRILLAATGHRVRRLVRLSFGEYVLGNIPAGHVRAVGLPPGWDQNECT
jgi:pseudouridine synthase